MDTRQTLWVRKDGWFGEMAHGSKCMRPLTLWNQEVRAEPIILPKEPAKRVRYSI